MEKIKDIDLRSNRMKKIALIHDLSGFGKCSLTAAIPVISVMGIQACPFPTAVLSSQTGFSSFYCDDYTDRMDRMLQEWIKLEEQFDGVFSGFLGSPEQIEKVIEFLKYFKQKSTCYLADPVMGDSGRCIKSFSEELLSGMKKLVSYADIATPNLTELCLLTGENYDEIIKHSQEEQYIDYLVQIVKKLFDQNKEINDAASEKQAIIVTGIIREKDQQKWIGNLLISKDNMEQVFYQETCYTEKGFSGTGDLFASVICGGVVRGMDIKDALELAIQFLQPAIEDATKENIESNHGVNFENYLKILI